MMRPVLLGVSIAVIAVAAGCSRVVERQPGQWEITARLTQLQLTGASPEDQARVNSDLNRTQTSSQCLTPELARDPLALARRLVVPDGMPQEDLNDCSFSDQVYSGGTIRVHLSCPRLRGGRLAMQYAVEGTFTETTMQYTRTSNAQFPAEASRPGVTGQRMTLEVSGRRVGECASGASPPAMSGNGL